MVVSQAQFVFALCILHTAYLAYRFRALVWWPLPWLASAIVAFSALVVQILLHISRFLVVNVEVYVLWAADSLSTTQWHSLLFSQMELFAILLMHHCLVLDRLDRCNSLCRFT
jgi:hypothetical protein